jgi:hypothetical protein
VGTAHHDLLWTGKRWALPTVFGGILWWAVPTLPYPQLLLKLPGLRADLPTGQILRSSRHNSLALHLC